MKYYFSKTISETFDEAVNLLKDGLITEGFGVICEIRLHEKIKEKLNFDFKRYTILEACNPVYALKALQLEDKIGTMLACNVLVIEQENGKIEVAAINPIASMRTIANAALYDVAHKISQSLKNIVDHI